MTVIDNMSDVTISSTTISIANKLQIVANNKIIIPGCEPSSAISSPTLAAGLNCPNPMVNLADALAAIPGSWIEYGHNSGYSRTMKWFVLPARNVTCPCSANVDYYQMLRDIAVEEEVTEDITCEMLDLGFCKLTDDQDSYQYTTPGGVAGQVGGILRWPPRWNNI